MYQMIARLSLLSVLLVFGQSGVAATDDARAFIVSLTRGLEAALKDGKKRGLLDDQQYLDGLIDKHILPFVDREALCKQIFRPKWDEIVAHNKANQAYDAVFASLKRTYRLALSAYDGQQIEISESTDKARYSIVRTYIHGGRDGHTIDLALRRLDNTWRIFDLSVDGVVVSKTLNGSIQRMLQEDNIDAIIRAINPQTQP